MVDFNEENQNESKNQVSKKIKYEKDFHGCHFIRSIYSKQG